MKYLGHAKKVDANQLEIVRALEKIGCVVCKIDQPVDLLCGYQSRNYLLEVKNPLGKNRVTPMQKEFMAGWKGQVRIVRSPDEAIKVITESYK